MRSVSFTYGVSHDETFVHQGIADTTGNFAKLTIDGGMLFYGPPVSPVRITNWNPTPISVEAPVVHVAAPDVKVVFTPDLAAEDAPDDHSHDAVDDEDDDTILEVGKGGDIKGNLVAIVAFVGVIAAAVGALLWHRRRNGGST